MTQTKANLFKIAVKIWLKAMMEKENKSIRTLDSRASKRVFQLAVVRWMF